MSIARDALQQHRSAVSPWLKMSIRFDQLLEKHRDQFRVNYSINVHEDMEMATFSCFQREGCSPSRDASYPYKDASYPYKDASPETKGNGAAALAEVCALADSLKVKLYLWTVYKELVPYYEGFGFEQTRHCANGLWRFIRPYSK